MMSIVAGPETELALFDVTSPSLAFGQGAQAAMEFLLIEGNGNAGEAADVLLAKLKTVDGAGSGLDADLLDGQSSAAFAPFTHTHTAAQISDGTAAGRAMLTAATATAQTALLDAATQSLKGLMAGNDKKKLDSRPYASLFDVIPASEWAAIQARTSTLDVTAYIQAAIDAGVAIVAPEGDYILGSAIKLKTGTAIRAMGAPGKVVFKASSAMTAPTMIDVNSLSGGTGIYAQSNILLDGITIDGNNRTLGSDAFLMRLYSVDGLTLRNLTIRNNQWGLAGIGGCRDVSLSGLRFRNWGRPAVSGEGGAALWLAGNGSVGDDTATSRVRGTDLDFADAEWCACYDFSTDSVFANVIIKDVKEGAFYCQNTQSGTASADNEALRHLYVNFNIKGVRRKYISAAGFEIAAPNSAIVNCNITDTDDTGIKVYWKNSSITISGCNIWDVVKQQASYATYTNYGHIELIQSNTVDDADITIVNNRLGSADVAPTAKYAIGLSNLNGAGHYFTGLNIQDNNFVNGFTTAAFYQANTPVAATDVTSAICNNIGADDLFNPFKVKRDNMLGGSDLVNAVENARFEKGSIGWTFDASYWAITNDPANARSGNWVAVNSDTGGLQRQFDSSYSAVEAGETVYAEAWLKTGASLTATNVRVVINWYDKDKVYLSAANGTNYTTPQVAYVLSAVSGPAPATACYFTVKVLAQKTVGTVYVDNVTAFKRRNAEKLLAPSTVTTVTMGGDVTAAGKAVLTAADATAQTALLDAATTLLKGLMSASDKVKLDAITGTNTGDETAAGILAKLLTVDGAGSGLDADLLDGQSSAAFAAASTAVAGPASSTDNAVVRFDLATGKLVQDSGVVIDDNGKLITPTVSTTSAGLNIGDGAATPAAPVNGDIWTNGGYLRYRAGGTNVALAGLGLGNAWLFKQTWFTSTAGSASFTMPHGVAPSAPGNGDFWTTTAGLFVRVNGVTERLGTAAEFNQSTAAQGAGFAADTYLTGSNCTIPAGGLKAGTRYKAVLDISKTAAGIAAPVISIRIGTLGTTGDTARATLTFSAQTAAADDGLLEVEATFRSVGSGTSAVIQAIGTLSHKLATTGLSVDNMGLARNTGAGFDSSTATVIGVSVNGGTSAAWTVQLVQATLENLA